MEADLAAASNPTKAHKYAKDQLAFNKVTELDWLEALTDWVQSMILPDSEPEEAMKWAVKTLNAEGATTLPSLPANKAGDVLVFPAIARNNVDEPERLNDLERWVDAAAMALH